MTVIAFDLDGTLSNPAAGITASLNYALEKLGEQKREAHFLTRYIGPPLPKIFAELLHTEDRDVITRAIAHYRERYLSIGYTENFLYEGIQETLKALTSRGIKLYVATSKRQDIARAVVNHLGIESYFADVLGCGLTQPKAELLRHILAQTGLTREHAHTLIMIGDRSYDMVAGCEVSANCIGVLWGFGSAIELQQAGAQVLVSTPHEMRSAINSVINTVHNDQLSKPASE